MCYYYLLIFFIYLLVESLKSPRDPEDNSPSILEISMEEPCTLSTPNFDSLPSYQVLGIHRTSQYIEGISRRCVMNFILELKTVF